MEVRRLLTRNACCFSFTSGSVYRSPSLPANVRAPMKGWRCPETLISSDFGRDSRFADGRMYRGMVSEERSERGRSAVGCRGTLTSPRGTRRVGSDLSESIGRLINFRPYGGQLLRPAVLSFFFLYSLVSQLLALLVLLFRRRPVAFVFTVQTALSFTLPDGYRSLCKFNGAFHNNKGGNNDKFMDSRIAWHPPRYEHSCHSLFFKYPLC